MQVVLMSQEKLIENALEMNRESAIVILNSVASWYQDRALALLLQAATGQAPVN